jgi:ubiquinone/menaquinone biosynthesis C-methylase UbiE
MPLVIDPAGNEIRALRHLLEWSGKRVLEIGCGDGRLTLRLDRFGPRSIEAIDPDAERIRMARRGQPKETRGHIHYRVGQAESLKYPEEAFDIVVFAWAL